MSIDSIWKKTLERFSENFEDKVIYDSIFAHLQAKEIIQNELIVTIEFAFNIGFVTEEYLHQLEDIYNDIAHTDYTIHLMTEEEYKELHKTQEPVEIYNDFLNPHYTFNNFVVGNSNRIAQNASLAVAMKPGIAYSPLFIYSESGLGKTHLLNAIGNFVKERNSSARILYTSSEQFVNEYVNALQNNTTSSFDKKYRSLDVLLIDDIQFFAAKEASSMTFFNIFNTLQHENKQIVITSDKPPKDLKGFENRLVSRFTNGLTVSIDTPEFETAKAILKKKIEIENIDYPIHEDVLDFIATHFNRDVRELEGSLNRLFFYKLVLGPSQEEINMEMALQAFADTYELQPKPKELTVDSIKKCVADYYNLTISQINSKSRTSHLIVARHIAMYLVRTLIPDISFVQIGKEFGGRDHSTVMKACSKVENSMKKDVNYKKAIDDIQSKLL